MKKSLRYSLSWSLIATSALMFGMASCTVTERNFGTTGGSGGTGGDAGTGGSAMACVPDTSESCYSGPPETLEVGVCKSGMHVCLPSGSGFGECGGDVVPTVENCLTPEDEACNGNDPTECPTLGDGWLKVFGSPGFLQLILDVAVTNTGDIVAVGGFADSIDFGLGPMASTGSADIFVAKFDPFGNAVWAKRFGDASSQIANAVAVDNTGAIYVGGQMFGNVDFEGTLLTSAGSSDAFIARFEADGTVGWAHNYGDTLSQSIRHLAVTKTNLIVAAGDFSGNIDFDTGANKHASAGSTDIFVARFDTSGFIAGSRSFGGPGIETIRGLAVNSTGQVLLTGGYEGVTDFSGNPLTSTGSRDAYAAILTPTLNVLNVLGFGNPNGPTSYQEGFDVAIGPGDEVFLSGGFDTGIDVGGQFLSNADPNSRSIFLAHFDPQLMVANGATQFGGTTGTVADARMAIDPQAKQIAIAGSFTGDMDFGGGVMHVDAAFDPYFAKLGLDFSFVAQRQLLNDPMVSDDINSFGTIALLPSGDLILGGFQRAPIVYGGATVGEVEGKLGNALLGRFLH